jgi:transcriptional/translational regulatory protein YebC/TACO1
MFNKKGIILIEQSDKINEDDIMMEAIDAGAEDFKVEDEYYEITTGPDDFSSVRTNLESKGYEFLEADVELVPVTTTKLIDAKQIELMDKLIEYLEDMDDVQNVFHNWDMPEEEDEE